DSLMSRNASRFKENVPREPHPTYPENGRWHGQRGRPLCPPSLLQGAGKHELILIPVYRHHIAWAELAFEDEPCNGILDVLLNGTLERPGSKHGVETTARKLRQRGIRDFQAHFLLGQASAKALQLNARDRLD